MLFQKNKSLVILVSIICFFPLAFYSTTLTLIHTWANSDTFTHGFLIFPITLWLIWQKKDVLQHLQAEPELKLVLLIVPFSLLWVVADIVDVNLVRQFALISLILTSIILILGRTIFKALLVPLLFLYFAIPFGEVLVPPLMAFTAFFTVSMVQLTGIPIYQDGLYFSLPSGNWSVVEACSGVRYLIASFVLGTIYAYISYNSVKKRLIFMLASLIVPIIANGLRAFLIVMIGHFSGMTLATGIDHLFFGWAFFGVVVFIVFYIGSRWWDPVLSLDDEIAALKKKKTNAHIPSIVKPSIALSTIVVFSLLISDWIQVKNSQTIEPAKITIAPQIQTWSQTHDHAIHWKPQIHSPDSEVLNSYSSNGAHIILYIAHYQTKTKNKEIISSRNRIDEGEDGAWRITNQGSFENDLMSVKETQLLKGKQKILIWYWYRMGNLETANPYYAKVFDAYNQFISQRLDSSLIAVATPLSDDLEMSRLTLQKFIESTKVEFNTALDKAAINAIIE